MTRTIELTYEQLNEMRKALSKHLGSIDFIRQEERYNFVESLYDMISDLEDELEEQED